ncbi:39279_t:CDS:2 [Gigaspora margarita]|uniref:39279_t:CDS:1 n=1 Tax=Gigaspora margarita TaxID=4874 RepID=A0ABN7UNC8_GIGMA|nr:39279_t:CDS:2 [Gigaspora margarita]
MENQLNEIRKVQNKNIMHGITKEPRKNYYYIVMKYDPENICYECLQLCTGEYWCNQCNARRLETKLIDGYIGNWDYTKKKWKRYGVNETLHLRGLGNSTNISMALLQAKRQHYGLKMCGLTKDPTKGNFLVVIKEHYYLSSCQECLTYLSGNWGWCIPYYEDDSSELSKQIKAIKFSEMKAQKYNPNQTKHPLAVYTSQPLSVNIKATVDIGLEIGVDFLCKFYINLYLNVKSTFKLQFRRFILVNNDEF